MADAGTFDALAARIERLEQEVATLRARGEPDGGPASEEPVSRRRLLGLAGAAAAGAVGAAVVNAAPASAAVDDPVLLGNQNQDAVASETSITSNANTVTFQGINTLAGGWGIAGSGSGVGVSGSSSGTGFGVWGAASSGVGVLASASSGESLHVNAPTANTDGAHVALAPGSIAGPPTGGDHSVGQLWMDSAGVLWQCVVAGVPGTWVRQSPLVGLAAPVRIYDSRPGQEPLAVGPKTPLAVNEDRPIDATLNSSGVPASASAVLLNLAVTGTVGVGFLGVFKDGIAYPGNANINWSASNQNISNAVTTAVANSAKFQVHCGGNPTNVVLDVIGYYP